MKLKKMEQKQKTKITLLDLGQTAIGSAKQPDMSAIYPHPAIFTSSNESTGDEVSHDNSLPAKKKLLLTATAVLIVSAAATGWFFNQNAKAASLLHSAQSSISKNDYKNAKSILDKAGHYFSFGSTKSQLKSLAAKDGVWINDQQAIDDATVLLKAGKFSEAGSLLVKIDKSFPGYSQVTLLNNSIVAEQTKSKTSSTAPPAVKIAPPKVATSPVPVPGAKRFKSTAQASVLAAATTVDQAEQALKSFASQYNLTLEITSVKPSSYAVLYDSYTLLGVSDLGALKTYGALFIDEWSKYPADWVAASNLNDIALVKNFASGGIHRAAGPDPIGETMYYDVGYSGDYAREVIHHEYDHLIEYNLFGSYNHSDPIWMSYNPTGFTYGNGGTSCYQAVNNCLSGEHPIPGFVSGYGVSAIEEDKAELYAYLMESTYYHHLKGWLATDSNLRSKVNAYKALINNYSPEMSGSYFDDINP